MWPSRCATGPRCWPTLRPGRPRSLADAAPAHALQQGGRQPDPRHVRRAPGRAGDVQADRGTPEALVTDSGGVFLAPTPSALRGARHPQAEIARRQAWQNLIEANFGAQMRMADYGFARATTWEEWLRVHEQWVDDFNAQAHWAHRQREEGRRTPAELLDRAVARPVAEAARHRVFYTLRFGRVLDARGYARSGIGRCTGSAAWRGSRPASGSTARSSPSSIATSPSPSSASPPPPANATSRQSRCCGRSRRRSAPRGRLLPLDDALAEGFARPGLRTAPKTPGR